MFKKYMHLERFGNDAVIGSELGKVWIFPKIDGTNSSLWFCDEDESIQAGSRTRHLSLEKDNAEFFNWSNAANIDHEIGIPQDSYYNFLQKYAHLRLFGEWLVPHSFKGYREDAWRKFYVFDVMDDTTDQYLSYEVYKPLLEEFGIEYIPPLATVKNVDYGRLVGFLKGNFFLIPDGGEPGEGIVIKNYDYINKHGVQCFSKLVRNEFKELNHKAFGPPEINGGLLNEERIVNQCLSLHLVEKTMAKVCTTKVLFQGKCDGQWESTWIPELLNRVFHDIITEELWDQWKAIQWGNINGKTLKSLCIARIKQLKPELFGGQAIREAQIT